MSVTEKEIKVKNFLASS